MAKYISQLSTLVDESRLKTVDRSLNRRISELEAIVERRGLLPELQPAMTQYEIDRRKYERIWQTRAISNRLIAGGFINGVVLFPVEFLFMHWIIAIISLVVTVGTGLMAIRIRPARPDIDEYERCFIQSKHRYELAQRHSEGLDG